MNKKMILLLWVLAAAGCTYAGERNIEDYLHDPKTWVNDPHFANYQEKRDALESRYLQKEISYAEYLEQRTALDDQYAQEVQERSEKIMGEEPARGR